MVTYIIRRALLSIPTVVVVLTLVFLVMRVAPGDPAIAALGQYASQATLEAFRERMGLNAPLWKQYVEYISSFSRGDLGRSMSSGEPISRIVVAVLPHTLILVVTATIIGIIVGVPLGIITAVKRNRALDNAVRVCSLAGVSIPTFYLGILLLLFFSVSIGVFPTRGAGSLGDPVDYANHLVLPSLALGLIKIAYVTRLTRSAMLETMSADYMRTARSKGISEQVVLCKHALKNVLVQLLTVMGMLLVLSIGGSVMIEIVFSRPGLGRVLVNAANQRDYTGIQSVMGVYAVLVIAGNLLIDLACMFVDPRITYD